MSMDDFNSTEYHLPLNINAEGNGPETNPDLVTETICWGDLEEWPCDWIRDKNAAR